MKHLFTCLFLLGATLPATFAELPPSAYEKMQSASSEVFRVKVLRVDVDPTDDAAVREVTVLAQVLKVGRTQKKVKPDDLITIKYRVTTHEPGWVGPGEVPILKDDMETVAYLQPIAGATDFAPAAGAMSFEHF